MESTTNQRELIKLIVNAMEDKKAEDIRIINISDITVLADYFIICNGTNKHQILAIQDNVLEALGKLGHEPKSIEGKNGDTWILMDYRDIVIHIFDNENRAFYNLERLWQDGKEINVKDL